MTKILSIAVLALIALFCVSQILDLQNVPGVASVIGSQNKIVYAECITQFSEEKLSAFTLTPVHLDSNNSIDALVQYADGEECGSAGCVYEICVQDDSGSYTHIPFGFAAEEIELGETTSNGMKDLILNNDKNRTMSWDGQTYTLNSN